jgi:hypothetical protein
VDKRKQSDRLVVLDIDGNTLAVFRGYDCPTLAEIKLAYPNFQKVQVTNTKGELRETLY